MSTVLTELVPEKGADFADRVLAHCLARLDDSGLTVESVARAHRVSVRYLHKLFAERSMTPLGVDSPPTAGPDPPGARRSGVRRPHGRGDRREVGRLHPTHLGRGLKAEFGRTAAEVRREG
ncbi:hypothetical protein GCM10009854_45140 [Saccharopolyspora halophila]|uniref:HTH araC/xylS-type domain-containing protein n=1 Tax=Saccharopolyspora halophila TaxID=405551 RepID=A0ABN3GU49_9PSEU